MSDDKWKKITTPKFRVSYPSVFEKSDMSDKYEVTALFPEGSDLSAMKKLATEKILEAYGSKDRIPKNFRMPFRKGADKEEYADLDVECFVTLKSAKRRPVVFDAAKNVIESETDFYGGCWARATVVCYVYTPSGKKKFAPGVAFGLQNIQKIEDDEPLGGGVMQGGGEDDFEVIEGSSEDSEAYTDENDLFG